MALQGEGTAGNAGQPVPAAPTAADLVLARDRLLGGRGPHQSGRLAPEALREALADLHEFWLTVHAAHAGIRSDGTGVALVAVGGLGRRELVPFSDLDLVLVHSGDRSIGKAAERLWYPLWNSGVGLDHSVRTVGEAIDVAAKDLRTALGLLDARHITGDPELSRQLADQAREAWRTGVRKRFDELIDSARERWRRSGEVAHWVEPDLKHGRGGLRDLAILDALALAQLVDRPAGDVAQARKLLLDTRTELRRIAGRPRDVLMPQDGDEIAAVLGIGDRFTLARALSGAGRAVAYALDVALRAGRQGGRAGNRKVLGVLRRGQARRPLAEGVVLHAEEVTLARDVEPGRDPGLLLRVAAAAARTGRPISPSALARLSESAPEPRAPWPEDVRQELVSLLGAGDGLIDVVEALDRTGLWARLFPEWGAVRDLPPRDAAHVWTVDRHLVAATAHAARLVTAVSRPDLLLIGTLLHDLGKGRDADHSVVGAALATQVGERLGLPAKDVATLSAMVRHHLLLPHTATRRNIEAEATVRRVVETLDGDPVLLELLHALAECDSLATGPGVWSDWKASLVADLVSRCRAAMAGEHPEGPKPIEPAARALAETVAESGRPEVLIDTGKPVATVTMVAPDNPGLLSLASGVLALHSLKVHAAELRSHAGVAVDTFSVSPKFGSLPDTGLLREQFARAVSGSLPLAERLVAKERDYADRPDDPPEPRVLWFDDEADGGAGSTHVVLELRAADRIGLLHGVAEALERCGANVVWARAMQVGGTAISSFSIAPASRGPDDTGKGGRDWRDEIERAVLAAC